MVKSIIAVVAGYATWTVVFLAGSAGIRAAFSSTHMEDGSVSDLVTLVVYLVVSILASGLAGYVGARLSPGNIKRDIYILCALLLATGIPVQLSAWSLLPPWYNIAFLILLAPMTIIGSKRVAAD